MKMQKKERKAVVADKVKSDLRFQLTEAYKMARTNLDFSVIKDGCKKIVFTSSLTREGKTTSSVNVAISLAQQMNTKVLLIDCDLRKPRVNHYFDVPATPGLTNFLGHMNDLEDVVHSTDTENLYLICSGVTVPNPSELLGSGAMQKLLTYLENTFDYIILDTPPLNVVIDALPLIKNSDGVVIVTYEGVSRHPELAKTLETLERVDAKVLGFILNGVKQEEKGYGKYKYSYKTYE